MRSIRRFNMSLRCHSCGEEYHYDMKICPNCEDDAVNSGLISFDGLSNNWRCDIFLEVNSLTFGLKNK